jgi:dephospho-CoA kinase
MKIIGLVGGVASGKSLAANMLVELGAVHLDADRAGHDVLAEDDDVRQALVDHWGDAILDANGRVDRAAVAQRVFDKSAVGTADRKFLEDLLHPRIGQRLSGVRDRAVAEGKPAIVLDAPLLLEADWGSLCDIILMIDSPKELRLKRALTRGWSETEFDQREAAQWPPDKKSSFADVVISNQGSPDDLRTAIAGFWRQNIVPAGDEFQGENSKSKPI